MNIENSLDDRSNTCYDTPLRQNLRKLMRQHDNISETELARQIHVPQPTVHKILSGRTTDPRVSTLRLIAEYFDVSIEHLLGLANEPIAKVRSVPILEWSNASQWAESRNSQSPPQSHHWIAVENAPARCFALTSRPSMEPRFPRGTIFIVNPDLPFRDGDLVIVHSPDSQECMLRELIIDGPHKMLVPILPGSHPDPLTDLSTIIGVVIQYQFSYYD